MPILRHTNPAPAERSNRPFRATHTLTTETAAQRRIDVIQLSDYYGNNLTTRASVMVQLSTRSDGFMTTATIAGASAAVDNGGTYGALSQLSAHRTYWGSADTLGRLSVRVRATATPSRFIAVILPDGRLSVSASMSFA